MYLRANWEKLRNRTVNLKIGYWHEYKLKYKEKQI